MAEQILEFKGRYDFLSNFYRKQFQYLGIWWPTSEHAYQAMKSYSQEVWKEVAQLRTAREAKDYGSRIRLRPDWEEVKVGEMFRVVSAKFLKTDLRFKLLATGDAYLSEGNWHGDDYWGYCFRTKQGRNELGQVLMQVRTLCRLPPPT